MCPRLLIAVLLVCATGLRAESVARFGVNQDFVWTKDEQIPGLIQAMKEAGVQAVRLPIRWTTVEPEREKWDFRKLTALSGRFVIPTLNSYPS